MTMARVMCATARPAGRAGSHRRKLVEGNSGGLSARASVAPRALWGVISRQTPQRAVLVLAAPGADDSKAAGAEEGEEEMEEILTPEEDWVISGGANDSLSSNTELGRAVRSACDELDALGRLEADVQTEAEKLLRQLGYTGDSLSRERPAEKDDE